MDIRSIDRFRGEKKRFLNMFLSINMDDSLTWSLERKSNLMNALILKMVA